MKIRRNSLKPRRLTLKSWAALDDLRNEIRDAAERGLWHEAIEPIFQSIEMGAGKIDRNSAWMDVAKAYGDVLEINQPTKSFPLLDSREKGKPMPWEYKGRTWYFWLNLFGKSYGWSEAEVAGMDVDDAIGLYQEILVDEQLEMEWEYGLSEVAYSYDKTTKKTKFVPMQRPDWMRMVSPESRNRPIKTMKIRADMMPQGNVVILDKS
jgi:hypothetical protein